MAESTESEMNLVEVKDYGKYLELKIFCPLAIKNPPDKIFGLIREDAASLGLAVSDVKENVFDGKSSLSGGISKTVEITHQANRVATVKYLSGYEAGPITGSGYTPGHSYLYYVIEIQKCFNQHELLLKILLKVFGARLP